MGDASVTILLVEDNEDDVMFFSRAWAKAGISLPMQVAYDGIEAVDYLSGKAAGSRASHVLLDLKLPKRSGLEVLEWIRGTSDLRSLPVIVLTSSQQPADVARARALGVTEYLVKPVSFPELVAVVRKIADLWQLPVGQSIP